MCIKYYVIMKLLKVIFICVFCLSLHHIYAQNDQEAIRRVLSDYIQGTAKGEPALLNNAFHEDLNLYSVNPDGTLKTWNGKDYISIFRQGQQRNRQGEILSIDFENNAATAKVEIKTPSKTYIDYFLLLKVNEKWKIIHKSYTEKQIIKEQPSLSVSENTNKIGLLEAKLDSLFQTTMNEQQIPGAALIIVQKGKVILKKGYGFTRLGEEINYVNPDSTVFRIGSITKSFTSLALLQQIDRKKIKLTDDINQHLTELEVPNTFDEPVTPFNLLTHSAGFDEIGGRRVFQENELIPLSNFLKTRLKRIRKPGEVTAYSTYGVALSGLLIENLSQLSFEDYMKENIWKPLGMHMTSIDLPVEHGTITSLGYEIHNNINIPQPWEWYHTFPASSINSTATDMGKYMRMLLNEGNIENNSILNKTLLNKMLTQQLALHPKTDGFTFGLYERKWNGIPSINHGGEMLGYSSFMTLLPQEGLGIFVVHHHEGTSLRHLAIETIISELVDDKPETSTDEKIEGDLTPYVGEYIWLSNCQTCPDSNNQQFWNLKINDDNTLSGFNRTFYQVEPLLFKSTDGERTMGFKKDKQGNIKYMSLGNINVFEKVR